MYRFLSKKELENYEIRRERVLEFYQKNAGRTIPYEVIVAEKRLLNGELIILVDNTKLSDYGIFTRIETGVAKITLIKKIEVDENKNLLLDF